MLPRYSTLVLIYLSSAFFSTAQEQGRFIPSAKGAFSSQVAFTSQSRLVSNADTVSCSCSVFPQIIPLSNQGLDRIYQGISNASCFPISITSTHEFTPVLTSFQYAIDTCGVSNVTYFWSIAIGSNIASINGGNTGSTVNVTINGSGNYTLRLENNVTCSNGSTCSNFTYYNDSARIDSSHCICTAGPVTIEPSNKQGNLWTYKGTATGTCTGEYGIAPNLSPCSLQNTTYQWSIAGGGVASIVGGTTGQTVNVAINGNGKFSLRLDGTTVCSDGKSCGNYNFYEDSGKVSSPKSCDCSVDVDCERKEDQGNLRTYSGVLKGGCTGEYGPSPPYLPCAIKNVTWLWQVSEGNKVAEIVGPDNQQTVNVHVIGTGAYTLRVQADLECNDGTKSCGEFNFDYCMDSADVNKNCSFIYTESNQPKMAGGLSDQTKKQNRIRRDEFIALIAGGKDYDKVTIECTSSYECDNAQKKNTKDVLLAGKVRFEWEIQQGDGNFVKLGILPKDAQDDEGDRVIFQPPYVPLPENGNETSKTTVVILKVIDETGVGPLLDETLFPQVIITTKRSKTDPDYYEVDVDAPDWSPPSPTLQENDEGVCKASYGWEKDNDLQKPVIILPEVPDNNKMVLSQWIILKAENQNETDELKMVCEATDCGSDGGRKDYPDDIEWTWTIENDDGHKGKFIGGNKGRFVIYAAPDSLQGGAGDLDVSFTVEVKNTGVQLDDNLKKSDQVSISVYQPGVQLEYPPLDWLPKPLFLRDAFVKLKSYLLYKENGKWKEALAHMGRIHFFELLDVSTETGFCMNAPEPKTADNCRDLFFEEDEQTELFERPNDPSLVNCSIKNTYWVHARSQKPQKEETIFVVTDDQGAYGFLRSFANINQGGRDSIKGELPVYVSVPIPPEMVPHPSGRPKKNIYTDDRVTVPRDVDENRIADGGWRTRGNALMKDPADPRGDDDDQLPGDGYPGDGLSNYQEYRGFLVDGAPIRTNIRNKDLFIYNPNGFGLLTFRNALTGDAGNSAVGLDVHQIRHSDYVDNATREINFNYNPLLHYIPPPSEEIRIQKGLWIIDGKAHKKIPGLLGQTYTADTVHFKNVNTPPYWVFGIAVYADAIRKYAARVHVNAEGLITHVATHELGHGIAMWHHGDTLHEKHGLQSGNINCIMRYDNILPDNVGEAFGAIFCPGPEGTGYNTEVPGVNCEPNECYGNATPGRGDCIHQFRISCRTINIPKR